MRSIPCWLWLLALAALAQVNVAPLAQFADAGGNRLILNRVTNGTPRRGARGTFLPACGQLSPARPPAPYLCVVDETQHKEFRKLLTAGDRFLAPGKVP